VAFCRGRTVTTPFQLGEDQLGDFPQRFEDALAGYGDGFRDRFSLDLKMLGQVFDSEDSGEVALVELQHVRDLAEIELVLFQVFAQVVQSFQVCVQSLFLRIRDEDDAIGAFQNQFAAGFVKNLPGTVYKWIRVLNPRTVPRSMGRKSKNNVRSVSVAREIHLALLSGPRMS